MESMFDMRRGEMYTLQAGGGDESPEGTMEWALTSMKKGEWPTEMTQILLLGEVCRQYSIRFLIIEDGE